MSPRALPDRVARRERRADPEATLRFLLGIAGAALVPVVSIFALPSVDLLTRNEGQLDGWASARIVLAIGLAAATAVLVLGLAARERRLARAAFAAAVVIGLLWPWARALDSLAALAGIVGVAGVAGAVLAARDRLARELLPVAALAGVALLGWVGVANALRRELPSPADPDWGLVRLAPERGSPAAAAAAERPDVFHVVLDEFQTEFFLAALDDRMREALGGFRFFPAATTPFGRTQMALAATFSGRAYDFATPPVDYVYDAFHAESSLLGRLAAAGYWTTAAMHEVYPQGGPPVFHERRLHGTASDTAAQEMREKAFFYLWLHVSLPPALARRMIPEVIAEGLADGTLLFHDVPYRSWLSFREWARSRPTYPGEDWPKYRFAHLILPHLPAVLDERCAFEPERRTRMRAQVACTLTTIAEWLEELERSGRFRDALIVLHGDHGARHVVRDGELVRLPHAYDDPGWQRGRSRPLLLVKPPGVARDEPFVIDRRPADLYDVMPTILDAAGVEPGPGLVGSSLLRPAPSPPRERAYHFYEIDLERIVGGPVERYRVADDGTLVHERTIELERGRLD